MIKTTMARRFMVCFAVAASAGCGGGGGDAGGQAPVATSASAGNATYGQTLLVTVQGSRLDQGIAGTSAGCRNVALSTTAPNISTATTAYFRCTVSAVGAQQFNVVRTSDNGVLTTAGFNAPQPQVTMTVSNGAAVSGSLVLTLDPARAPATVDNFLNYVNAGFYAGTVIHRHSPGFVLQGGGYAGPLTAGGAIPNEKPTNAAIVLEDNAGLSNLRYTIAMARTGTPNSATSQFFINLADNVFLNRTGPADNQRGYAVFGSVTGNPALVDAMAAAPCAAWPAFLFTGECLPTPNLTVTAATQTR